MRMRALLALALGLVAPARLAAQWQVGLEVVAERFHGFTRAVDPPERGLRPYRPLWVGLRVEGSGSGIRPGLAVLYARPDLALEGADLVIVPHEKWLDVLSVQPMLIANLATLRDGVRLRGEAGPVLELWYVRNEDSRVRAGGQAGLSLEVVLGGRFSALIGGYVGVIPKSPLDGVDLTEEFEPSTAWRRAMRGGVRFRL